MQVGRGTAQCQIAAPSRTSHSSNGRELFDMRLKFLTCVTMSIEIGFGTLLLDAGRAV